MKRFFVCVAAVVGSVVGFASDALAQVVVTVPAEMDPATHINSIFAQLGGYMLPIITAVVVISVGVALVRYAARIPRRIAR